MADRRFDTGDPVAGYKRHRLECLIGNDAGGGEVAVFGIYIHETVDSLEMLPAAVRRHFRAAILADRPRSRGEQVAEVCRKLEAIYDHGGSWDTVLAELELASCGAPVRGGDHLR